eukprot:9744447-Karenia_brevis.AAC.1
MTEIHGLKGSWIRARDARWYEYFANRVLISEGKTLEQIDSSISPIKDLCIVDDPHALIKDKFVFDSACGRMKILSVEYGSYGAS